MAKKEKGLTTKEAFEVVDLENRLGLPAGGLQQMIAANSTPMPGVAALPMPGGAPAPEGMEGGASWQDTLAGLASPAQAPTGVAPEMDTSVLDQISDTATQDQDRLLANMLNDGGNPQAVDTSKLPSAVDRYLDKLLA